MIVYVKASFTFNSFICGVMMLTKLCGEGTESATSDRLALDKLKIYLFG